MAKHNSNKKPKVHADTFAAKKSTSKKTKDINPFEVHTNKEKFSILGRKLKHDKGLPGVSRSKANKKRKETLGQEYIQQHKVNKFKDNRIGKIGMSKEDAAGARFIAERLNQFKSKKSSLFNLNDDEQLTHKGQTLEEIEQFQDTISDDDEDDEIGKLDAEFTGAAHFGGDGVIDGDFRNRKGAIEDLIADQKRRKAEVSREKEEVSEMTQKLDDNWRSLITLMDLNKGEELQPKPDEFDRALKEMVFEPRGTVTDKLKSEEKLIKKEKARLERLESERLERMHGLTEEEKKIKHRSADDLDDGYFLNTNFVDEKQIKTLAYDTEGQANHHADDSDEELERLIRENGKANGHSDGENSDNSDNDAEGSGSNTDGNDENDNEDAENDEDEFSDLVYDSVSEDETNKSVENSRKKRRSLSLSTSTAPNTSIVSTAAEKEAMMEKAAKELPYTFELPQKYADLEKLLSKQNADYQSVILDRMIKCNHPKVEPTNKEKMVALFAFLLQHINDITDNATTNNIENVFSILDRITPHLYDLSHLNPAETTRCFLEVIKEKQSEFRNDEKQYPTLDTLSFLKLVSHLYSASDFRHTVASPCVIFISQILSRCRVRNRSEIASGLFLVTTLLEYTQLSKRFLPAAVNFLAGVLFLCVQKRPIQQLKVIPPFKSSGDHSSLLVLSKKQSKKLFEVNLLTSKDLIETEIDDLFKVRALNTTLLLINDLFELVTDSIGVKYLIEPFERYLDQIDLAKYPKFIAEKVDLFKNTAKIINGKHLPYLVPALKKTKALRQLEPKFERIYDDKRNRKPGSKQKAIREGMVRKIKKDTKTAVREIRRDNAFLSQLQFKKQMHSDAERKEKVKRIFAEASIQQGELNAMDRKKKHL